MKILIVDDEELARLRLRRLVEDLAKQQMPVEIAGDAADAAQAQAWLNREKCDVVLLDIQMPGLAGTDLAARLRARADAPVVVFVTAHPEHAVQAFELEAVDYVTKPVRLERLREALQRAAQRLAARAPTSGAANAGESAVIVVQERGRVHRVPVSEVLYLKAELKYVTLRTAEHSYVLDDSLSDLEQRLGDSFLRVHRNALVAKRAIRALQRHVLEGEEGEGWAVRVAPLDEWIAVSRRQLPAVREALSSKDA